MTRVILLSMICACFGWGQNAHPRIWLDSATLTRLTNSKNANSQEWRDVKADADRYATYSVPAFDRSACTSNAICYTYQGGGWYDAVMPLAVAYKMTGDTKYSNQLKAVLAVMTATILGLGSLLYKTYSSKVMEQL